MIDIMFLFIYNVRVCSEFKKKHLSKKKKVREMMAKMGQIFPRETKLLFGCTSSAFVTSSSDYRVSINWYWRHDALPSLRTYYTTTKKKKRQPTPPPTPSSRSRSYTYKASNLYVLTCFFFSASFYRSFFFLLLLLNNLKEKIYRWRPPKK